MVVFSLRPLPNEESMAITENTLLIRQALAYVIELYHELTEENGGPHSAP
jgi:hypothetical protein